MMDFKQQLYRTYSSTHNSLLYGPISLAKVERNFAVYNYYYKKLLPKNKNAKILDIGCGDGHFIYYLQKQGYYNSIGIDLSEEQINVGKSLGIEGIFVSELINYLSHTELKFDCIIARDVIEHLTKQEAFDALNHISEALNTSGSLIMQVPNGQGLFYTSIFYGDYTHEMPYTIKTVQQLLLNTGFNKTECFAINPFTGNIKGKIRSILWSMKVLQIRFWKMIETGDPNGIFTSNLIAKGYK